MSAEFFERVAALLREGRSLAIATVLETEGSTPRKAGARMAVLEDGTVLDSVGGGAFEARVLSDARELLARGGTAIREYSLRKDPSQKVRLAAVASAAFAGGTAVFEPILAVLKSRDSSAEMRGASASALKSITSQDFGQDADRWARWYEQSRRKPPSP